MFNFLYNNAVSTDCLISTTLHHFLENITPLIAVTQSQTDQSQRVPHDNAHMATTKRNNTRRIVDRYVVELADVYVNILNLSTAT